MASSCPASQRLKASESLAISQARSDWARGASTTTGAENPRSSDGSAGSATSSKTKLCSAKVRLSTRVVPRAVFSPSSRRGKSPALPTSPTATGMWKGSFSGWPGVGLVACVSVRVRRRAAASWLQRAVTLGVPAWAYQRRNWPRSVPEASSMAATKSSQVTAAPSWRAKYRSMPLRKASAPIRVWIMRMTSAPFS